MKYFRRRNQIKSNDLRCRYFNQDLPGFESKIREFLFLNSATICDLNGVIGPLDSWVERLNSSELWTLAQSSHPCKIRIMMLFQLSIGGNLVGKYIRSAKHINFIAFS